MSYLSISITFFKLFSERDTNLKFLDFEINNRFHNFIDKENIDIGL